MSPLLWVGISVVMIIKGVMHIVDLCEGWFWMLSRKSLESSRDRQPNGSNYHIVRVTVVRPSAMWYTQWSIIYKSLLLGRLRATKTHFEFFRNTGLKEILAVFRTKHYFYPV